MSVGNKKPAVFPDPVCAHAIRSRLEIPMGMEYFCTGVGLVYPHRLVVRIRSSPSMSTSKLSMGSGTFSPDVSTGMSSYWTLGRGGGVEGRGGGVC